jgi:hypothetical protein
MILKNRTCYYREKSHSQTIVTLPHYKRLYYKFYALPVTISMFGFIFVCVPFAAIYLCLLVFFAWFNFLRGIFSIADMGWCCWGCIHWHILSHILTGYRQYSPSLLHPINVKNHLNMPLHWMNVKRITMKVHMSKNDQIFTHSWGCPDKGGQFERKFLKDEILNLKRI